MDALRKSDSVCLFDANVLIDLYKANIFNFLTNFPHQCLTTDFVLNESRDFSCDYAYSCGLGSHSFSGDLVSEVLEISKNWKRKSSIADISCYVVAVRHNYCLVTGDSTLRKHAERKGIEVHGVLWVLDEMVEYSVLSPLKASDALIAIKDNGAFLPDYEIDKRLTNWKLRGLDEDRS